MLRIEELTITFDRPILKNVNLLVAPATSVAIDGKSGSGKTTLLKFIMGELVPQSGRLYFNDEEINETNRDAFLFNSVSYVDQMGSYFTNMTIHQHFTFYSQLHHLKVTEQQEIEYLKMVALEDIDLNKSPAYLSTGQRKRFLMALALMMKKQIILLDEPTASLDNRSKETLIKVLTSLTKEGITIIMATHDDMVLDNSDAKYTINGCALVNTKEQIVVTKGMVKEVTKPSKVKYNKYKNIKLKVLFIIFLCIGILSISVISQTIATSITLNVLNNKKVEVDKNVALFFSKQLDLRDSRDFSLGIDPNSVANDFITQEDIEKVKAIDGVLEVEPYYHIFNVNKVSSTFNIYKDGKLLATEDFNYTYSDGNVVAYPTTISAYYPFQDITYKDKKATGVYVNEHFVEYMGIDDVENITLEFETSIPNKIEKRVDGSGIPGITTWDKKETMKLKIDGMLPNLNYDIFEYGGDDARIYMPVDQVKQLLSKADITYEGFDTPYTQYQSRQYMIYCDGNKAEDIKLGIEKIDERYVIGSQRIGDVMVRAFTTHQNESATTMTVLMTGGLFVGTVLLMIYIINQRKSEVALLKREGLKNTITTYYIKDYYIMAIIWSIISLGYAWFYPQWKLSLIRDALPMASFLTIWGVTTGILVVSIIILARVIIKKIYVGSARK